MVYEIQLGFWDGLLVTTAILLGIWGFIYAASLTIGIAWVVLIGVTTLLLYVIGKRFVRWLIKGGGKPFSRYKQGNSSHDNK